MALGKINGSKYSLSAEEEKKCHKIIHSSSTAAAAVGAGLAQIPLADNTVITPIQISMVLSLGKVFDQDLSKTIAKSILAGCSASVAGRGVSQAAWGWIPGFGNTSNAITAAAITETIGWLAVDHFYKKKYLKEVIDDNLEVRTDEATQEAERSCEDDRVLREALKVRAEEFLNGCKNKEQNLDELINLLDDLMEYLKDRPETDELNIYHKSLLKL